MIEEHEEQCYLAIGPVMISLSGREWLYAATYYLRWWLPYTLLWVIRCALCWLARWPLWYAEVMFYRCHVFAKVLQVRTYALENYLALVLRRDHKVSLRVVASNDPAQARREASPGADG